MDPASVRDAARVPHGGSTDPDVLDFSANVNPEVPEGVREVYDAAFERSRRYPDDRYADFRAAAGDHVDCAPDEVVPTAGGLAAIRLALSVLVSPGDVVLVPYPSFGEYEREVELQGATPRFVPYDEVLEADPAQYEVVIVCTPNNPTGDVTPPDALRSYAARCREVATTLLVDEAFLGFTDHPSLAGTPGVVVARSLTKLFGLPGLRAGYAAATGDVLDALTVARPTWSLGTPAAATGTVAMRDQGFVRETRKRVRSERDRMVDALDDRGFDVHPSDAPFLLLDVGSDPTNLVSACLERGIAIRDATTFPDLDTHVRVAIRTPDENDRLLEVLADVRD